jgi:hypothetical protein
MSKVMQHLYRRGRHARKPMEERRRYDLSGVAAIINHALMQAQGKRMVVYLDGDPIERCIVADEIAGLVVQVVYPVQLMPDMTMKTVTRRGVVGVEIEDAS